MSNPVTVVTSFNLDGYNLYGKEFLSTFDSMWPQTVDLEIYTSPDVPRIKLDRHNVNQVDYNLDDHKALFEFMEDWNGRVVRDGITANGILPNGNYAMKYDAIKFAWKTFAIIYATYQHIDREFFWLDADTITHSPISTHNIQEWMGHDPNVYTRYLGRSQNPKPMYSECGFVYYNARSPIHQGFMYEWERMYVEGHVFDLPEWHDSFVYDYLVNKLLQADEHASWTAHMKNASTHPFIQIFGNWMDHRKGPRKHSRSGKHELVVGNNAEYWK